MSIRSFSLVVCLLGVGCGQSIEKRACMKVGSSDPLVTGAQLFRLDVYGSGIKCSGNDVAVGTGAPLMSHTYVKGQAIAIDVPPGPHTLVLVTYADKNGMFVLGKGCTQTTLTPGAQICFDLALTVPLLEDMAAAPGDLTGADLASAPINCVAGYCPGGLTCCSGQCVDLTTNINNCGACGSACDQTNSFGARCSGSACVYTSCKTGFSDCNTAPPDTDGCETNLDGDVDNCGQCGRACQSAGVATRHCSAGLCDSTCPAGSGNCSMPAAPAADDGCETNTTNDTSHCGACDKTCSYGHAAASCVSSTCQMGACDSGYFNCDSSATNGCEAAGFDFGAGKGCCSGTTPATTGTAMIQHDSGIKISGVEQHFYDCLGLGTPGNNTTYTQQLATDCAKQTATVAGIDVSQLVPFQDSYNAGSYTSTQMCKQKAGAICVCWAYSGGTTKVGNPAESFPAGYVDINTTADNKGNVNCFPPSPDYPVSVGGPDAPWF